MPDHSSNAHLLAELGRASGLSSAELERISARSTDSDVLVALQRIVASLSEVYTREGIRVWLKSPNKQLGGASPLLLVAQHNARRVIDLAAELRGL